MWAPIVYFLKSNLLRVVGVLSIVFTVLVVLLGARKAGRQAEKLERVQATLKAVEIRNEVERHVDTSDDAERKRLRLKWTRSD